MIKNFKVDFIGIGAQKSATSWLFKCMVEHPDVCGPKSKEVHFFSKDEKFSKGIEFYKTYFEHCNRNNVIGEFSTSYLTSNKAPKRIKQLFPEIKIIVCLRNPVDRAFSHFLHLQSKNRLPKNASLKMAIKKYPQIIENGMYGKYLQKYFSVFSKNQILVLFYKDIKNNPEKVIKSIYKFLGVDDKFLPKGIDKKYNTSAARLSPWHNRINKIYFKLKKSKTGRRTMNIIKFFGINSYTFYDFLIKLSRQKKVISNKDKKYLQNIYKQDIKKLEKIVNKDLSFWR